MSDVNKEIALYPMSGDKVRFVSTSKLPIGGFETELHPIQDLHGQEYPYPAGGGKNKWNYDVDIDDSIYTHNINPSLIQPVLEFLNSQIGNTVSWSAEVTGTASGADIGQIRFIYGTTNVLNINNGSSKVVPEFDFTTITSAIIYGSNTGATIKNCQLELGSTPTPYAPYENICPIYGYDSISIYVSPTPDITDETKVHTIEFPVQGYNQWDEEWEVGVYNSSNGVKAKGNNRIRNKNFITVVPNTSYYIHINNWGAFSIYSYDYDKKYNGTLPVTNSVFTTSANCHYINFNTGVDSGDVYNNDISINYPATETGYYPYKGRTVYAGTLTVNEDGSGQIVSKYAKKNLGDLTWAVIPGNHGFSADLNDYKFDSSVQALCTRYKFDGVVSASASMQYRSDKSLCLFYASGNLARKLYVKDSAYTTAQDFKSAMSSSDAQLVYELATPVVINLTEQEVIETLIGFNYVWNNVGTTNIVFQYYTGGEGMAITFLDCWTYPKAKLDEMFKAVTDRLDALEEASADSNAKTTLLETKEEATETVAEVEREGDE